MGAVFSNIF